MHEKKKMDTMVKLLEETLYKREESKEKQLFSLKNMFLKKIHGGTM